MKKDKLSNILDTKWARFLLVLFGVLFVFILWEIISACANSSIVPNPRIVFAEFFKMLGQSSTYLAIGATFLRLIIAFAVSFSIAFIIGILAGLNEHFKTFLSPLILLLKTIPTATLVFAFFVYFRNNVTLFLVIFLVMFPILYEAISNGISNIDKNIISALRVDARLYEPKALFKVIIPCSAQYIILGIIQTLGLGMKVAIMAEILIGERDIPGLGVNIIGGYIDGMAKVIFANSLFAIIIIGAIDLFAHHLKKKIK